MNTIISFKVNQLIFFYQSLKLMILQQVILRFQIPGISLGGNNNSAKGHAFKNIMPYLKCR